MSDEHTPSDATSKAADVHTPELAGAAAPTVASPVVTVPTETVVAVVTEEKPNTKVRDASLALGVTLGVGLMTAGASLGWSLLWGAAGSLLTFKILNSDKIA